MINEIVQKFADLCIGYAKEKNAVYHSFEEGKKECIFTVELKLLKMEFCFVKKASTFVSPGTLYSRFFLRKNTVVRYHLPDIIAALKLGDFRSCYFSFIENPQRLENCFSALTAIIDSHLPEIERAILSGSLDNGELFESYIHIFDLKKSDLNFELIDTDELDGNYFIYLQNWRNDLLVNRFTVAAPYSAFLKGDREKAIALYEKFSKKEALLPYEEKLINFLRSENSKDFTPITKECFAQKMGEKNANISPLEMLKLFSVSYVFFAAVFCAVFAILNAVISAGSLYFFATPWYCGLIPAALCAIFASMAFRRQIYKITAKKELKEKLDMDSLINGKKTNALAIGAFIAFSLVSVLGSAMMLSDHILVYENSVKYLAEDLSYNEYSFEELSAVYYVSARYNDFGDRIERPSYVLVAEDGQIIDLDGYTSVKTSEATVIPLLKKKGFKAIKLDSDRELPGNKPHKD